MQGRSVLEAVFCAAGLVIVWGAKKLARLAFAGIWYLIRHPRSTLTAAAAAGLVVALGWKLCVAGLLVFFLAGSTWRVAHEASWEDTFGGWLRTWWHRWWIYRRQWERVMFRSGLVIEADHERFGPTLKRVRGNRYWDRLTVVMPIGQDLAGWKDSSEKLRHAFGAQRLTVQESQPRVVRVDLMHRDPLRRTVPPTAIPSSVAEIDFSRVPIGLTEHLEPFTMSVVGGCTAAAGTMNAGKAGVIWNALRGLGPAIAEGYVQPIGIDPKAKELGQARALFADGDYAVQPEEVRDLLERLVAEMNAANLRDAALGERDFTPSLDRPLRLILIDELAPLLHYWPRATVQKCEEKLGLLITQGRAAGYIVVGLIQEPTKDVFRLRDLFARRMGLRLATTSNTDAILIDDAVKEMGARCHEIPESMPGELYAMRSGDKHATRARLGYVENHHIAELVEFVEARRSVTSLDERRNRRDAA